MSKLLRNPFHLPVTMERVRSPDEFFRHFSPSMLERICSRLAEPRSHFVVGPNGCGKTTCLRFLQYRNQTYISNSVDLEHEFRDLLGQLPKEYVGIYYTVRMGPIGRFGGKGIDSQVVWANMYANYLNYVLVEELVRLLSWCRNDDNAAWAEKQGIRVSSLSNTTSGLDTIVAEAARKCGALSLAKDLEKRDSSSPSGLERVNEALVRRLDEYHRLLSATRLKTKDIPQENVDAGVLLHNVVESLREREVLGRATTLFVMMDEYDALAWCEENELLRRVINACVSSSSRIIGSGIQYKIGSRRWALQDMLILGSNNIIEIERDYAIIDLAHEMDWVRYQPFAEDVTNRLLQSAEDFEVKNFRDLLAVSPEGAASGQLYCGYDSVISASYPVIFYHLRLCRNLIENALPSLQQGVWQISARDQDDAIRFLADRLFEEISTERSRLGSQLQSMISRLGHLFQTSTPPTASILVARSVYDQNKGARKLLEEAVDHALLERRDTRSTDILPPPMKNGFVYTLCNTLRPMFMLPLKGEGKPIPIPEEPLAALVARQDDKWANERSGLIGDSQQGDLLRDLHH